MLSQNKGSSRRVNRKKSSDAASISDSSEGDYFSNFEFVKHPPTENARQINNISNFTKGF